MNNVELLSARLRTDPENDTLASALVDCVQEELGYERSAADQWVDGVRDAAYLASAMTCAAWHLSPDGPVRELILEKLRVAALLPPGADICVLLIEGDGRCWSPVAGPLAVPPAGRRPVFTVGHLYVLQFVAHVASVRYAEEANAHLRRAR